MTNNIKRDILYLRKNINANKGLYMDNKIKNIYDFNFSLDFLYDCVDLENCLIVDGIFKGFKFAFNDNKINFFKYFLEDGQQQVILTSIDKNTLITENNIIGQFVSDFTQVAAEKIWNISCKNFNLQLRHHLFLDINKIELPKEMQAMNDIFYNIHFSPKSCANLKNPPVVMVWQYLEGNIDAVLKQRCDKEIKNNPLFKKTHLQNNFQDEISRVSKAFYDNFEKQCVIFPNKTK